MAPHRVQAFHPIDNQDQWIYADLQIDTSISHSFNLSFRSRSGLTFKDIFKGIKTCGLYDCGYITRMTIQPPAHDTKGQILASVVNPNQLGLKSIPKDLPESVKQDCGYFAMDLLNEFLEECSGLKALRIMGIQSLNFSTRGQNSQQPAPWLNKLRLEKLDISKPYEEQVPPLLVMSLITPLEYDSTEAGIGIGKWSIPPPGAGAAVDAMGIATGNEKRKPNTNHNHNDDHNHGNDDNNANQNYSNNCDIDDDDNSIYPATPTSISSSPFDQNEQQQAVVKPVPEFMYSTYATLKVLSSLFTDQIRHLNLAGCQLDEEGFRMICMFGNSLLETLNISHVQHIPRIPHDSHSNNGGNSSRQNMTVSDTVGSRRVLTILGTFKRLKVLKAEGFLCNAGDFARTRLAAKKEQYEMIKVCMKKQEFDQWCRVLWLKLNGVHDRFHFLVA